MSPQENPSEDSLGRRRDQQTVVNMQAGSYRSEEPTGYEDFPRLFSTHRTVDSTSHLHGKHPGNDPHMQVHSHSPLLPRDLVPSKPLATPSTSLFQFLVPTSNSRADSPLRGMDLPSVRLLSLLRLDKTEVLHSQGPR